MLFFFFFYCALCFTVLYMRLWTQELSFYALLIAFSVGLVWAVKAQRRTIVSKKKQTFSHWNRLTGSFHGWTHFCKAYKGLKPRFFLKLDAVNLGQISNVRAFTPSQLAFLSLCLTHTHTLSPPSPPSRAHTRGRADAALSAVCRGVLLLTVVWIEAAEHPLLSGCCRARLCSALHNGTP